MSLTVLGSNGAGGGYNLESSLRFRSSAGAYLSRTPTTAGNQTTWTWSGWIKRGNLSSSQFIFEAGTTQNETNRIYINSSGKLNFQTIVSGVEISSLITTALYRDPSAWYHIIFAVDTTQATSSNRVKIYVNGSQVTAFGTATYQSQNSNTYVNSTIAHTIGRRAFDTTLPFDGYMTEVNFVDGQALTPSDFGETDTITGVWKPKEYTGTYGTNGFYLDGSGVTDGSGNGNNWTNNNLNLSNSALTTYDLMNDVPTLTDEDTANFPTLNPLIPPDPTTGSSTNLLDGSLTSSTYSASYNTWATATWALPSTGKYYWEVNIDSSAGNGDWSQIGILKVDEGDYLQPRENGEGRVYAGYYGYKNTSLPSPLGGSAYGATYGANDTIGIAVDMDNGAIYFSKNNTWQNSGVPTSGASKTGAAFTDITDSAQWMPMSYTGSVYGKIYFNFGQRPFKYTPPTGYKKLNTYNLPDSTIKDGSEYFDVDTWSGDSNATTQIPTPFSPDFVWIKNRSNTGGSGASSHMFYDTIRGVQKELQSNLTDAEGTLSTGLNSFDSDGYKPGTSTRTNATGNTYVGWSWRGSDSSAVTDSTTGAEYSANTTAGFSIVKYTGDGDTSASRPYIPHGLGVTPSMIIYKRTDATGNWVVTHKSLSSQSQSYLILNSTAGQASSSPNTVQGSFNSAGFRPRWTDASSGNIINTAEYVAYVFADVEGFSKFGSYEGNGSADGPFVYTGFDVKFLLYKNADATNSWVLYDSVRDPNGNPQSYYLIPNSSGAEGASPDAIDFLSNGFKIRYANASINTNGQTHIYMAFAENPFKNSLAR